MGLIAFGEIDDALDSKKRKERERRSVEDFSEWY
jgi:hypothetical protein